MPYTGGVSYSVWLGKLVIDRPISSFRSNDEATLCQQGAEGISEATRPFCMHSRWSELSRPPSDDSLVVAKYSMSDISPFDLNSGASFTLSQRASLMDRQIDPTGM